MNILIYLSHPAQFHFFKNPVRQLESAGHQIFILSRGKDVLHSLLEINGCKFTEILGVKKCQSLFCLFISLIIRDIKITAFAIRHRIDLMAGSDASIAHAAALLSIPSISFIEDDAAIIPKLAWLTFPFTKSILTPHICDAGRWNHKKTGYDGYMKLSYLAPKWFTPDRQRVNLTPDRNYTLIRLSALRAHHDARQSGISRLLLREIVNLASNWGDVWISSEECLPEDLAKFRLTLNPCDIHHYLSFARVLVCDSQSMAVEASILGTPSVRISSFKGKISVLEELEIKYELTFGFHPVNSQNALNKLEELLKSPSLSEDFNRKRKAMLAQKTDVASLTAWFIGHFPESKNQLKNNPDLFKIFSL